MTKQIGGFCFLLLFAGLQSEGQVSQLSLKEAVEIGLKSNPNFAASAERVKELGFEKEKLKSVLWPELSANAGAHKKKAAAAANNPPFGGESYNEYEAGLKLKQGLFKFGTFDAISASDLRSQSEVLKLSIEERKLVFSVIQSYFRIYLKSEVVKSLERQQKLVRESLTVAESRSKTGRGQILDVLQVKTQLANLEAQHETASNEFQVASAALGELLGLNQKQSFELTAAWRIPPKEFLNKWSSPLMSSAQPELPELKLAKLQVSEVAFNRSAALGAYGPELALVGEYKFLANKSASLFESERNSWSLGLTLSLPLFQGLTSIQERRSWTSKELQAEKKLSATMNELSFKSLSAQKNLDSAFKAIEVGQEALSLAQAASREAQRNYKFSSLDVLQYLSVQKDLVQVELNLNNYYFQAVEALGNFFISNGLDLLILTRWLSEGVS